MAWRWGGDLAQGWLFAGLLVTRNSPTSLFAWTLLLFRKTKHPTPLASHASFNRCLSSTAWLLSLSSFWLPDLGTGSRARDAHSEQAALFLSLAAFTKVAVLGAVSTISASVYEAGCCFSTAKCNLFLFKDWYPV